jgi:hypothetical protein
MRVFWFMREFLVHAQAGVPPTENCLHVLASQWDFYYLKLEYPGSKK